MTYKIMYALHAILSPNRAYKPTKTIIDCSFHHFAEDVFFLTWHCGITTVQSVMSCKHKLLALQCYIHQMFLHVQISTKAIFINEYQQWITVYSKPLPKQPWLNSPMHPELNKLLNIVERHYNMANSLLNTNTVVRGGRSFELKASVLFTFATVIL